MTELVVSSKQITVPAKGSTFDMVNQVQLPRKQMSYSSMQYFIYLNHKTAELTVCVNECKT